jgi:hypothetical protein
MFLDFCAVLNGVFRHKNSFQPKPNFQAGLRGATSKVDFQIADRQNVDCKIIEIVITILK